MTMGRLVASLLLLVIASRGAAAEPSAADRDFFEKRVRPLLVEKCYQCHSTQANKRKGGLLLDSAAGLAAGGDSGPVIVAGKPDESLLIRAIRQSEDVSAMPPTGRLSAAEVATLEEWVRRGAVFPGPTTAVRREGGIDLDAGRKHWAFQPLREQPVPAIADAAWPMRRIDAFIRAEQAAHGLQPAAPATKREWLRRVSFGLIGLPPTPEELAAFEADPSPVAREAIVERLLASPRYGERWARHWLDLVRYADVREDWADCKGDAWRYRDWVVQAFNHDLPYDQFVIRQLAADLLPGLPPTERAALGFLGLSPKYWKELKLDPNVIRLVVAEEWEEKIQAVGGTFLGLTIGCARCHDHKHDPIRTQDYYALAGVFASCREIDRPLSADGSGPKVPAVEETGLFVVADGPHRTRLNYQPGKTQDVAVQIRGNPANIGPVVPRGFLAVLSAGEPRRFTRGSGRLELAEAIVGDAASLSARVIVNRVWRHHFGRGLVETPSDFGTQGDRPSHPALLDDLALRFVQHGWSLKWLHREIVLSATYAQSSRANPATVQADPDNRWLARSPRRKLEVEAWRDAMLTVSGLLQPTMGGPAQDLAAPTNRRRTLYGTVHRRELSPLLRLHDFPDPIGHVPTRLPTTTPLQQLYVLNSPAMLTVADALVARLLREAPTTEARIQRVYQWLYQRSATPAQVQRLVAFLGPGTPTQWQPVAQVLLASNEFLYLD